ncbi:cytochrome P450 [Mycena sp. CBHHK59/15]|nr:cytochrome P450 [Mycena sp. CBHHK59/15]
MFPRIPQKEIRHPQTHHCIWPYALSMFSSGWAVSLTLVIILISYRLRKKASPPLPPGPRGLPLVGNISDVPSNDYWVGFAELGNVWGDISSLTIFGQTMVIVNSLSIAEDLLDVRGSNFSERPVIQMGGELVGFRNTLSLSQYGDRVRKERKLFHQLFGSQNTVQRFAPLIESEIRKFLGNLLQNQTKVEDEIQRSTGAIVLRIAYGYHILDGPGKDPYIDLFDTAAENFTNSTKPAAFLVDIIPALRYWPEWLPGGGFHTTAKAWSKQLLEAIETPYSYVKIQMASAAAGTAETSFTSSLLEQRPDEEYLIKWAAASIQAGGSDTTASQLEAFFLAMSLYPDVQAAAQKELDAVIGSDRLPQSSDRAQLPYMNALCKEVLRWHVAAPTGIPHRTREDFIYDRGGDFEPLLIPKDSIVIPNIWKMTHDPERYADPMTFNPSRFIDKDGQEPEQDPSRICFGYGRRICPGKLLADTTLFIACSMIISVFNISKAHDENGVAIEPRLGQTSGTVSRPLPFKCTVEARSARASALVSEGLT